MNENCTISLFAPALFPKIYAKSYLVKGAGQKRGIIGDIFDTPTEIVGQNVSRPKF